MDVTGNLNELVAVNAARVCVCVAEHTPVVLREQLLRVQLDHQRSAAELAAGATGS